MIGLENYIYGENKILRMMKNCEKKYQNGLIFLSPSNNSDTSKPGTGTLESTGIFGPTYVFHLFNMNRISFCPGESAQSGLGYIFFFWTIGISNVLCKRKRDILLNSRHKYAEPQTD